MLGELDELQESDENLSAVEMSFDIETRTEAGDEVVHKTYTFSQAKEWGKWMFVEYIEKRSPTDSLRRNWRKSQHIMWNDVDDTPSIDVPPEVSQALRAATGADSITIQEP